MERFVSVLNHNLNNKTDFFKRFTVHMSSTQIDALLPKLENAVEIPDKGSFCDWQNEEIWVLKA